MVANPSTTIESSNADINGDSESSAASVHLPFHSTLYTPSFKKFLESYLIREHPNIDTSKLRSELISPLSKTQLWFDSKERAEILQELDVMNKKA